jgi:hypothetical protein
MLTTAGAAALLLEDTPTPLAIVWAMTVPMDKTSPSKEETIKRDIVASTLCKKSHKK